MLPIVLGWRLVVDSRILSQVVVESARVVSRGRGSDRLLHDCAVIGRMLMTDRPSAAERLQHEVGVRLTDLLRSALTGDQTLQHSWQVTAEAAWSCFDRGVAVVSDPDFASLRPEGGRIVVLHPERPTAVSPGMGRNMKQRMVSPVGASQARARKAALNKGAPSTRGAPLLPRLIRSTLPASAMTKHATPGSCSAQTSTPSYEKCPATTRSHPST